MKYLIYIISATLFSCIAEQKKQIQNCNYCLNGSSILNFKTSSCELWLPQADSIYEENQTELDLPNNSIYYFSGNSIWFDNTTLQEFRIVNNKITFGNLRIGEGSQAFRNLYKPSKDSLNMIYHQVPKMDIIIYTEIDENDKIKSIGGYLY